MGDTANYFRAALGQGLGMGWGDEAEAWLRSKLPGGKTYEEERDKINREYGEFARRNPVSSAATEFAGGVLPMVATYVATPFTGGAAAPAAAATTARTAGALSRLATNPYVRGALVGTGTGAVAGAGSAQPGERGRGAVTGGTVGAVVGGGAPVVIRSAGAGGRWLRDRLAPTEETVTTRATEKVNRALQEAGLTPAEVEARVAADRARGIPATVANVDPALVDLAETVAQRSGPSGRRVEQTLGRQTAGTRERTYAQTRGALQPGDFYAEEQALVESLRRRADTLYDEAYAVGSVRDPRITAALEDPQFKSFYDRAREIADREALAAKLRGEDPAKFKLEEIYVVDPDGNARLVGVPDVRTLDYIKRGIDATIERGFKGEGMSTAEANSLKDLRRVFVNAIDEATTDPRTGVSPYRAARAEYAGDMEVLDAMRTGMNDFRKLDHEEVMKMIAGMSQAEKDAFKTGVVRDIYSTIMNPSGNINAAQRVIGSPEMAAKLQPLFDSPAQFNLFKSALEREAQLFQQSNRILGGAATGRRTQARERFEEGPAVGQVVGDAITGGFGGSLTNLAARVARSATMTDDVADKVATMLMSSEPAEVAAAVKLLEDYSVKSARSAANLSRGETGAIMGTVISGQPAPPGPEGEGLNLTIDQPADMSGPSIEADIAAELQRAQPNTAAPARPRNVPGPAMTAPASAGPSIEADIAAEIEAERRARQGGQ